MLRGHPTRILSPLAALPPAPRGSSAAEPEAPDEVIDDVRRIILVAAVAAACGPAPPDSPVASAEAPRIEFEPYEFESGDGTRIAAERGAFRVPENRARRDAREIELGFVRFAATGPDPGPPIVYLAGGPGGSGVATARGRRFPLFMAMREFGDVIAFDQRGTGWSNDLEPCSGGPPPPLDAPLDLERVTVELHAAAAECAERWAAAGVDLSGYNTLESARDLDALRRGLGVERVSLWAISYGTHLALASLEVMPEGIDRMVLAAVEGLDHTVKLPARTDAYFERLQRAIELDPAAAAAFPDLPAMMRRVHDRLSESPVTVSFPDGSGGTVSMVVGRDDMRLLSASSIADPSTARRLPAAYRSVESGDLSEVAPLIYQRFRSSAFRFRGMPEAMDIMSGVSPARLALVRDQAPTSILGDVLNFPMPHLRGAMGLADLGEEFRMPVETNVRTLMLTGTLDGRTYPEGAAEVAASFSNIHRVIVEHGGHNLFMQSPEIGELILRFMRGEQVPGSVTLDPPTFPGS